MASATSAAPGLLAKPTGTEWLALQRKVFTRWANLKLATRDLALCIKPPNDIVTGLTAELLVELMEVLSEKPFPGKKLAVSKLRPQQIDNCNRAIHFVVADCGVELEVKLSPENLCDHDERNTLGLVWGLMRKYMKFGDDDKLNAKDALLAWVKNQVNGYKNVKVENFTKSFHDGLALCALIHKNRPKMLDFDSLNPANAQANLQVAFDAAEKYFGLEKYLQVSDIAKLDEKSMMVYVSEYFAGIAAQRKIDLAARRIAKLVHFTEINDAMRAEYAAKGAALKDQLVKVSKVLMDRTCDNTMAGAKKRLEEFYEYQSKDKVPIINDYLSIEQLSNHLAVRLADHQRPPFVPAAGQALPDLRAAFEPLEKCEQERNAAVHAEINRQTKLAQHFSQLHAQCDQAHAWAADKHVYLSADANVKSSGAAECALNLLAAYAEEYEEMKGGAIADITALAHTLVNEKFEHSAQVTEMVAKVESEFKALAELHKTKQAVLADALAREEFKEKTMLVVAQHKNSCANLQSWISEKAAYLQQKEAIDGVGAAEVQLNKLAIFAAAYVLTKQGFPAVQQQGAHVLAAKFATAHSQWTYPAPEEIKSLEQALQDGFANLDNLHAAKLAVLKDDLAREQFKENVEKKAEMHAHNFQTLQHWITEKEAYLSAEEPVTCVRDARVALDALALYEKLKADHSPELTALQTLGAEIINAKYETSLSSYLYDKIDEIKAHESFVVDKFASMDEQAAAKKGVLSAALSKELEKEKLRMAFAGFAARLQRFAKDTVDKLAAEHFGFTLKEVTEYGSSTLTPWSAELQAKAAALHASCTSSFSAGAALGVVDNQYTALTPDTCAQSVSTVAAALEAYAQRYAAEQKRQQANDALCRVFADEATAFTAKVNESKDKVSGSKLELDAQVAALAELVNAAQSQSGLGAALPSLQQRQEAIDAAGITHNEHTLMTYRDVDAQWKQYLAFLERKKKQLEEEIQTKKLRGITPQQHEEIETQFKQYDKNKNNVLDQTEFKACLYSLGLEFDGLKLKALLSQFGDGTHITHDGFKEFMIQQLGDTDTKDEVLGGFKLIARGDVSAVKVDSLAEVLPSDTLAYLVAHAPKAPAPNSLLYTDFTNSMFAR